MWIYNRKENECINTDEIGKIYIQSYKNVKTYDLSIQYSCDDLTNYEVLKSFCTLNEAEKELNKIVKAIAENKSVYILD